MRGGCVLYPHSASVGVQVPIMADLLLGKRHFKNYTGGWVGLGSGLHGFRKSRSAGRLEPHTA